MLCNFSNPNCGLGLNNTLPPKYKYFVVQQFFKPKRWFGFENHFKMKTLVFISNNFLDALRVFKT